MNKNTFKEEFNWLSFNLPESLVQSPELMDFENIIQSISEEILNSNQNQDEFIETIGIAENEPEIISWDDNEVKFENLFEALVEIYHSNGEEIPEVTLSALIGELGREAFGMYLPMHYYFESKKTPWGIYLFPDTIIPWAKNLYKAKGKSLGLSLKQVAYAFTYAVFRHELFHHQVERFSTKHEILTNQVNYKTYGNNVNWPTRNSEDWLEEALAEATVLNSVHVFRNIKIKPRTFRELYEFDLKRMPAGYRDYHCKKHGGIEKAHQLFASQIIQCRINPMPTISTTMCTVSANEFSVSWKKVPIYMVKFNKPQGIDSPRQILFVDKGDIQGIK